MPPLRLRIRVALLRRDAALCVIPRVHAHRYSGVADQSALQVSPLLILAAVADLHQQRRALGVHRQGQTEVVVLDQAVLRETPLLRNVYTDVYISVEYIFQPLSIENLNYSFCFRHAHLVAAGVVTGIETHVSVEKVAHAV